MILDFLLALIVFAFIITIVVSAHEFGHFLGAKKTKTKVTEFAIGFPPFIWKKQIGETLFAIGSIPFGGYNKIYGESEPVDNQKDPSSFTSKTTFQKFIIIISGVVGNFLLSILLFYIILFSSNLNSSVGLINPEYKFPFGHQENYLLIGDVKEDSPAHLSGINKDEFILEINETRVQSANELNTILEQTKGEVIRVLTRERETKLETVHTIDNKEAVLGIGYTSIANISYNSSLKDKVFSGAMHTYNFADYSLKTLGGIIADSFKAKDASIATNAIAGPVGIFAITKISLGEGFMHMLNLTAIISLALAITNLLPLPALDGGKCVYLFFQKINPRVFTDELSEKIDSAGFILLMCLGVLIIIKDIFQFKDFIF